MIKIKNVINYLNMSTLNLDAVLRGLEDDRVTTRKTAVGDFGSLLTDAGVLAALNRAPGSGPAAATSGVMCWTREDVQLIFLLHPSDCIIGFKYKVY